MLHHGIRRITSRDVGPFEYPRNGLLNEWLFVGNADDTGPGPLVNGSVSGAVLTPDRLGNANSAYLLNGINDFISFGTSPLLPNGTFSVLFWNSPTSFNVFSLLAELLATGTNGFIFYQNATSPRIDFGFRGNKLQRTGISYSSGFQMNVLTYNGGNRNIASSFTYNRNGVADIVIAQAPTIGGATTTNYLGRQSSGSFYPGIFDDVLFYNRVIGHPEALTIYNGSKP